MTRHLETDSLYHNPHAGILSMIHMLMSAGVNLCAKSKVESLGKILTDNHITLANLQNREDASLIIAIMGFLNDAEILTYIRGIDSNEGDTHAIHPVIRVLYLRVITPISHNS